MKAVVCLLALSLPLGSAFAPVLELPLSNSNIGPARTKLPLAAVTSRRFNQKRVKGVRLAVAKATPRARRSDARERSTLSNPSTTGSRCPCVNSPLAPALARQASMWRVLCCALLVASR